MVRQSTEKLSERLDKFAVKFEQVMNGGHCASLTDNAMGNLAFQGHDVIQELQLNPRPGQVMIHLNTFHSRTELHEILDACGEWNIRNLLIISGDGSIRLPKLAPGDLGISGEAVTSVELIAYIKKLHGDFFQTGVAFNQYEPPHHEMEKLARKLAVGADFVITQPVIEPTPLIDELCAETPVPLYLEAWMSAKIELLNDCIGYEIAPADGFDPIATLRRLEAAYPDSCFYLALLNFAKQFALLNPTEVEK